MRRTTLVGTRFSLAAGVAFQLAALVCAAAVEARPRFVAYHDRSPADHKKQTASLSSQGYRMISLSVYGGSKIGPVTIPRRYAAVWVERAGRPFVAVQDQSAAGFQDRFDFWAARGYKPTLIAATGSASAPIFAAVFEESSGPIPYTRYGLRRGRNDDPGTIDYWNKKAHDEGLVPTTLAIYGSDTEPRYAGVWEPNFRRVAWGADGLNESFDEYQRRFDAQVKVWNRPALLAVSPAGRYLSLFRDDAIGPWVVRYGLTSAGYQAEYDHWVAQGFYPIAVQAGGPGVRPLFAAIFAQQEAALPRSFTATGSPASPGVDEAMRRMMQANGVRQAALAVVQGRRLLTARGYTLAEAGYPLTQPTTYFRVASCSKTITSLAIHQLLDLGLTLEDRVQDILDLRSPDGGPPQDARFSDITIGQLLSHTSGIADSWDLEVQAAGAFKAPLPATKAQIASLVESKMLASAPGTVFRYSNDGYVLLGLVVEKKRGTSFIRAVNEHIGTPLGARRIRLSPALLVRQPANEARYHHDALLVQPSVQSDLRPLVPEQYGGWTLASFDAAGGLSLAAPDFAKILAALNVTPNPILRHDQVQAMLQNSYGWDFMKQRSSRGGPFYHGVKGGYIGGLQSMINYTEGDISYVVYWAKNEVRGVWYPDFPELEGAIRSTKWGAADRFPDFGIPSFPTPPSF